MSLGMGFDMRQEFSTSLRQTLSLAQRLAMIASHRLSLRLELIACLHDTEHNGSNSTASYKPKGQCPKCFRQLSPIEIIGGFNTDPNDFTTSCPKCKTRFEPRIVWNNSNMTAKIVLPFYCDSQTLSRISSLKDLSPEEFKKNHPDLYHSAIVHRGTLKMAFKGIGIDYAFDELANPVKKLQQFLGRLPDTVIAEVSGLRVNVIRRERKKHGIKACTNRSMLREAQRVENDQEESEE